VNRRWFLKRLAALGAGIVVAGPAVLAEVQRNLKPGDDASGIWQRVGGGKNAYYSYYFDFRFGPVPAIRLESQRVPMKRDVSGGSAPADPLLEILE